MVVKREVITLHASAAKIATFNIDVDNLHYKGAIFVLDVTAVSGTTPTLDIKLQYRDVVSGKFIDIPLAIFTQKTATGSDVLTIYPAIAVVANESVNGVLPINYRVVGTITGTTPSFTFTLTADYLP